MGFPAWYSNFWAEGVKMYLRGLFAFGCWTEVIVMWRLGYFEEGFVPGDSDWDENWNLRKIPLIVLFTLGSLWNNVEKWGYSGTRFVVMCGAL